jgi:sulfur carrier protein ThiS adenylyltransferase
MTSLKLPSDDRFLRQQSLIATTKLRHTSATVIGVGAIGRQVAIQLAALGVGSLQLIDFDLVESHNVTSQGYRGNEVGSAKVIATAHAISEIDQDVPVETVQDRFRLRTPCSDIVFCCVDSIQTRSLIWNHLKRRFSFWSDARMLGEVIRVLSATDESRSIKKYSDSLFSDADAQTGSCTSRSTIYTANIAAGLMVHQFTRWLRKLPLDDGLCFNLLSSELTPT